MIRVRHAADIEADVNHPYERTGREPDFGQMLKVLRGQVPDRPVLYEFAINWRLIRAFADPGLDPEDQNDPANPYLATAWRNMGFDYLMAGATWRLAKGERAKDQTVSLNEGALITDRASFEAYDWSWPDESHFTFIREARLPDGMKIITSTPGGLLENAVQLVGYERLCYLSLDDPALVADVFNAVGARLVRYYEICAGYDNVGACCHNDDWGFKTQTMLSPEAMRQHVIPWHRRVVQVIHAAGKPALLHACGNLEAVMDDVIDGIGYEAKHSFEDSILPVEEAYERWAGRIAILGGIDVDFLCRSSPDRIAARSLAMLERTDGRGGYALGSGNSIPEYVPDDHFLAMTGVALERGRLKLSKPPQAQAERGAAHRS
jgi:uroporphyrinogen decarboxylase